MGLNEPLPYGSSSMGLSGPFLLPKDCPVGLSGLEPPTSRLSGVRSNQLSYKPLDSGSHLLSHAVSSIVSSAALVLTVVFGMGTGISPERIATGSFEHLMSARLRRRTNLVRKLFAAT